MKELMCRLALAAFAAATLAGCDNKKAEAPKEYAPPPTVGPGGGLKGGEAPSAPVRPTK
jgi:hypothetical protein